MQWPSKPKTGGSNPPEGTWWLWCSGNTTLCGGVIAGSNPTSHPLKQGEAERRVEKIFEKNL